MTPITDPHTPERASVDRCSECGVFYSAGGANCNCRGNDAS